MAASYLDTASHRLRIGRRGGQHRRHREPAHAQAAYPTKPIRLVVGFAAGGPSDILARIAANSMSKTLGQQVYVENRTGASGNLATELVARAQPDGYTLLLSTFIARSTRLCSRTSNTRPTNISPRSPTWSRPAWCCWCIPSLDVKSVKDLAALAKSKPGEVPYATAGKGTATHLAAELFNAAAGIKMTPVHYRGRGDTIKDLLSGQVKVMFSTIPPVLGFVRTAAARARDLGPQAR